MSATGDLPYVWHTLRGSARTFRRGAKHWQISGLGIAPGSHGQDSPTVCRLKGAQEAPGSRPGRDGRLPGTLIPSGRIRRHVALWRTLERRTLEPSNVEPSNRRVPNRIQYVDTLRADSSPRDVVATNTGGWLNPSIQRIARAVLPSLIDKRGPIETRSRETFIRYSERFPYRAMG